MQRESMPPSQRMFLADELAAVFVELWSKATGAPLFEEEADEEFYTEAAQERFDRGYDMVEREISAVLESDSPEPWRERLLQNLASALEPRGAVAAWILERHGVSAELHTQRLVRETLERALGSRKTTPGRSPDGP